MLSSYYSPNAKMPTVRFHQIKSHEVDPAEGSDTGQVLGKIAQKYGINVEHILQENPGIHSTTSEADAKADALVGQILVINLKYSDSLLT